MSAAQLVLRPEERPVIDIQKCYRERLLGPGLVSTEGKEETREEQSTQRKRARHSWEIYIM